MRDYLEKVRLKFLYRLGRILAVKPFLKIDAFQYCPACGNRDSRSTLNARILERPDAGGSKVGVVHTCGLCHFTHVLPSVSVITSYLNESEETEDDRDLRKMQEPQKPTNLRITQKAGAAN